MDQLLRNPDPEFVHRRWQVMIVAVAVALLAAGCAGGGDGAGPTTAPTTESSETTTTGRAASSAAVGLDELCSPSLTIEELDLEPASAIPTFEGDQIGEDGARAMLDDLIDPDVTFCGLDVSAQTQAIIDAADAAFASGDADAATEILRGLLDDQQAWIPFLHEGVLAAGAPDESQRMRDLFGAAAAAYLQGNDELGDEMARQAQDLAVDVATTKAQQTNEPAVLLTVAAQAQLLGANDVAQMAIDKALAIVTVELDKLTQGDPDLGTPPFDPCTATPEEAGKYADAIGRVILLGGDDGDGSSAAEGMDNVMTTYNRMHDYQLAADDCGNMVFTAIEEVPGWDGLIELELRTCDAAVWTGVMTIDVTLSAGGGTGRQSGIAEATVVLNLGDVQGSNSIQLDRTMTFEAAGQTMQVSNPLDGTITFGVDAHKATAKAVVEFPSSTETVSAGGMSFSMPVQEMHAEFTGTLSHDGECG